MEFSEGYNTDNLIAVVQIFRHGQRAPVTPYPKDPYKDAKLYGAAFGALTNTGKREMHDLGQFTQNRYKKFLPSAYTKDSLLIYTTDVDRSIVSAQSYATGLYPSWNSIPTYVADEPILRSVPVFFCPAYTEALKKSLDKHLEEFKQSSDAEYILLHSGLTADDYSQLAYLYDNCSVALTVGLKLPEWTKKVYPDVLKEVTLNYLVGTFETDQMKRLCAGPFLYELIQHFDKMTTDPSSGPKLIAYSGHDTNIGNILSTFGAFDYCLPEPASSIFIELKRNNSEPFINIFYKKGEEIVPIQVTGNEFDCSLDNLKKAVKKYTLSKEEFYNECSL